MAQDNFNLPADSPEWGKRIDSDKKPPGWTLAHEAAGEGKLPAGFSRWDIADQNGWTVAHYAAVKGHLPEGFNRWEFRDEDGYTVAHAAAVKGHLPESFNQWELADEDGWTVAHEAAVWGHLPESFTRWELADRSGRTVAHEAALRGRLPADVPDEVLAFTDNNGRTVAEAVLKDDRHDPRFLKRAGAVMENIGEKAGESARPAP